MVISGLFGGRLQFKIFSLKSLLSILLVLAIVVGFQNCSKSSSGVGDSQSAEATKNQWSSRNGNGDGYLKADGTYVNTASDGQCEESSVVVVENGKATLVRENCKDIAPKVITSNVEAREYSPDVLFFTNKLFERRPKPASPFSEVVCRGVAQTDPDGTVSYADVILAPTGRTTQFQNRTVSIYSGSIKTGSYSALNELIHAQEEATPVVFKDIMPENGKVIYRFLKRVDRKSSVSVTDQLSAQDNYQLVVDDGKGNFFYVSESSNIHYSIRNMKCYQH